MPIWKKKARREEKLGMSLHPVIEALLIQRGYRDRESAECFLAPDYDRDLESPFQFRDMEKVVNRIGHAKENHEKVGIFGDFDADGITSSVILRETLSSLGISSVVYLPHKIDEGHGLNEKAIDFFAGENARVVLTLDCGMMNHAAIQYANEKGREVIIIDHHHVPEILPAAFAIINPKLPNEAYPFRELCGAGTTFKVASALYERFLPEKRNDLKWLLDVAATGTVADVMPLVGENRTLVKYGLIVLQKTKRIGFQEMIAVGKIPVGETLPPDARTIAFHIAPRINAASRMAHPQLAHDLLMEGDRVKARGLALELETYNIARQKVSQETSEMIRRLVEEKFHDKKFIFAVDAKYPLGVIGLVAGKIAHEYGKPTCILQRGEGTSTGSFRSIPGLNIIEALETCAPLLEKFGGHAQAAGMRIKNENLDAFYERFNGEIEKRLAERVMEPELSIDLVLEPSEMTLDLVRELLQLEPFGEGNPEPVFVLENMTVLEARTVGKDGKHWKLKLQNGGAPHIFDAVGWSLVSSFPHLKEGEVIDIAFTLSENIWQGRSRLQLKLIDIQKR